MENATSTLRAPSKSDLASLPWGAQVALAVRCAKRVLPLAGEDFGQDRFAELSSAVFVLELMSASRGAGARSEAVQAAAKICEIISAAKRFEREWGGAADRATSPEKLEYVAAHVAFFQRVRLVATAASSAALCVKNGTGTGPIAWLERIGMTSGCHQVVKCAVQAPPADDARTETARAIREDIATIRAASEQRGSGARYDQDFFGSMWPGGEPAGWPDFGLCALKASHPA